MKYSKNEINILQEIAIKFDKSKLEAVDTLEKYHESIYAIGALHNFLDNILCFKVVELSAIEEAAIILMKDKLYFHLTNINL